VQDDFQSWDLDDLVEGVGLGDVWHDGNGEVSRGGLRGVRFTDLGRFLLGADRGHDAVAFGEELVQNVG
jgi:hypothetical protein